MASSSCPKCDGTSFETKEITPLGGSSNKYNVLQCSKCGAVVGVADNITLQEKIVTILEKLAK